jgi:hypothetical protein
MAIFWDAPVAPDDVTSYVREVPLPSVLQLSAEFPVEFEQDNTVNFLDIVRTNRTARFRTWDGRLHVSSRDTGSEKRVRLIPLSSSLTMGEYEKLQVLFARTRGTNQAALAAAIYNDADNLVREVRFRMEQAIGDMLTDGVLTINENGYQGTADFGLNAGQLKTPATLWSTVATATILDDVITWTDDYATNAVYGNGVRPARMKTSLRVIRLMQRNAQLIGAIYGTTSGKTRVTLDDINTLFASEGLPTIDPPYDTVVDVDGTATRVIPDNRVLFLPQNLGDLGAVKFGVSATALELVNSNSSDLSFEDAPGIVGVVDKDGPPYREQTLVDAVGMPVIKNSRALMVATVA